jgi:hypothetical protein
MINGWHISAITFGVWLLIMSSIAGWTRDTSPSRHATPIERRCVLQCLGEP